MRPVQGLIEDLADRLTRHPKTGLSYWILPTSGIDDRQDPKRPSIGQGIMHKILPPLLSWHGVEERISGEARAIEGAAN